MIPAVSPYRSALMNIADVALLTQPLKQLLSYEIPVGLTDSIGPGTAVSVPLQNRLVPGIVITRRAAPRAAQKLKPIHSQLDPEPVLTPAQLELAQWISTEYAAPLGRCCALMVPPGFTPKSSWYYELADPNASAAPGIEAQIVAVLRGRGQLLEQKLRKSLPPSADWRAALERLVKRGLITRTATLQAPRVAPQRSGLVQLVVSEQTLTLALTSLITPPTPSRIQPATRERRAAVLRYLQSRNGLAWADWIFAETGANRADLTWLAEQGYVLLGDAERWRDPLADVDFIVKDAPPLTGDQQQAWDTVAAGMHALPSVLTAPAAYLLRGVTGSGKTEIYMRAVDAALKAGRGAIMLVPEISLTPQTSRRFLERFPGKVALIHSRLRPGERFDTWRRIRAGELPIVVGARSALFAPLAECWADCAG